MATSSKRSPLIPPRPGKAYRLEMEGRTILLTLSMMGLTGVVIFALGIVTGMGMRDPNGAIPVAALSTTPPESGEPTPKPESLAFNAGVKSPEATIEGLTRKEAEVSGETRSLLKRAERELKLEELPVKRAAASSNPPRKPKEPATRQPAAASNPPGAGRQLYTVQVFSSRRQANARELMVRLKRQGFDAYMNQYQGADRKTWYRVRVGKLNRADAQRTADRLKSQAKLKAPRIIQL